MIRITYGILAIVIASVMAVIGAVQIYYYTLNNGSDSGCDNTLSGLSLTPVQYFLGGGIADVVLAAMIIGAAVAFMVVKKPNLQPLLFAVIVMYLLFGIGWFIIGTIVVFYENGLLCSPFDFRIVLWLTMFVRITIQIPTTSALLCTKIQPEGFDKVEEHV